MVWESCKKTFRNCFNLSGLFKVVRHLIQQESVWAFIYAKMSLKKVVEKFGSISLHILGRISTNTGPLSALYSKLNGTFCALNSLLLNKKVLKDEYIKVNKYQ